jgi:hypothetical protein
MILSQLLTAAGTWERNDLAALLRALPGQEDRQDRAEIRLVR